MNLNPNYFIYVDFFVFLSLFIFSFIGYSKGFVSQMIDLANWFVCLFVAGRLSKVFAHLFSQFLSSSFVWFILLVLIWRVISFVILLTNRKLSHLHAYSVLDHVSGMVLGTGKGLVVVFICFLLLKSPLIQNGQEAIDSGILHIVDRWTDPWLGGNIHEFER